MNNSIVLNIGTNPSAGLLNSKGEITIIREEALRKQSGIFGFPGAALARVLYDNKLTYEEVSEVCIFDTYFPSKYAKNLFSSDTFIKIKDSSTVDFESFRKDLNFTNADFHLISLKMSQLSTIKTITKLEKFLLFNFDSGFDSYPMQISLYDKGNLKPLFNWDIEYSIPHFYRFLLDYFGFSISNSHESYFKLIKNQNPTTNDLLFFDFNREKKNFVMKNNTEKGFFPWKNCNFKLPDSTVAILKKENPENIAAVFQHSLEQMVNSMLLLLKSDFQDLPIIFIGDLFKNLKIKNVLKNNAHFLLSDAVENLLPLGHLSSEKKDKIQVTSLEIGDSLDKSINLKVKEFFKSCLVSETPSELLKNGNSLGIFCGKGNLSQDSLGKRSILFPQAKKEFIDRLNSSTSNFLSFKPVKNITLDYPANSSLQGISPFLQREISEFESPYYYNLLQVAKDKTLFHMNMSCQKNTPAMFMSDAMETFELGIFDYLVSDTFVLKVPDTKRDNFEAMVGAISAFEGDKDDQAMELFEAIALKDNKSALSFYYIGMISYLRKNYFEALKYFNKAIQANPFFTPPYYSSVSLLLTLNYTKEALNLINMLSINSEDLPDLHFHKALVFNSMNLLQESFKCINDALILAPLDEKYLPTHTAWKEIVKSYMKKNFLPNLITLELVDKNGEMNLETFKRFISQLHKKSQTKLVISGTSDLSKSLNISRFINLFKEKMGENGFTEIMIDIDKISDIKTLQRKLIFATVDKLTIIISKESIEASVIRPEILEKIQSLLETFKDEAAMKKELYVPDISSYDENFIAIQRNYFNDYDYIGSGENLKSGVSCHDIYGDKPNRVGQIPCLLPNYSLVVSKDGKYFPCWEALCANEYGQNIFEETLIGFWNGGYMNSVSEQQFTHQNIVLQKCQTCTYPRRFAPNLFTLEDYRNRDSKLSILKEMAEELSVNKQLKECIEICQLIQKEVPDSADCLFDLGDLHFELKEFEKALNYYSQGVEKNPNILEIYFKISEVLVHLNRLDEANNILKQLKGAM